MKVHELIERLLKFQQNADVQCEYEQGVRWDVFDVESSHEVCEGSASDRIIDLCIIHHGRMR